MYKAHIPPCSTHTVLLLPCMQLPTSGVELGCRSRFDSTLVHSLAIHRGPCLLLSPVGPPDLPLWTDGCLVEQPHTQATCDNYLEQAKHNGWPGYKPNCGGVLIVGPGEAVLRTVDSEYSPVHTEQQLQPRSIHESTYSPQIHN